MTSAASQRARPNRRTPLGSRDGKEGGRVFHYRYIYKTVFGTKWQDLDAESDEAADRIFWKDKLSDLNEIVMVEKSSLPVDEKGGGSDESKHTDGKGEKLA